LVAGSDNSFFAVFLLGIETRISSLENGLSFVSQVLRFWSG